MIPFKIIYKKQTKKDIFFIFIRVQFMILSLVAIFWLRCTLLEKKSNEESLERKATFKIESK